MVLTMLSRAEKTMLFCCFLLLFTLNARAGNAPYLVLNGADTVISEQGRAFTDPGAVAYDSANNIISNPNIIVSGPPSGYIYIPGTYTLKYNFQHNGVAATEIYRTVIVITDTTAPVLTVLGVPKDSLGYFTDTVAVFETYTAPQATAQDLTDGNLSASIMINSNVNTSVVGTYTVTYSVADFANNKTEKTLYVIVGDTVAPVIEIADTQNDTLYIGESFDYNAHEVTYTDNNGNADITVTQFGTFLTVFPNGKATMGGTYSLGYLAIDKSGNVSSVSMTIVVIDTLPDISGYITLGSINYKFHRNATVYLIKFDASDSSLSAVDTTTIDTSTLSYFSFKDVTHGIYLVKAALDSTDSLYTNYLPTYYGGALTWDNAQTINLIGITYIDISLIAGTNTGGPGFISGKVSQGANKKEGDPLENIQIILTTDDDKPVTYTYSDENGYFEFKNLALGKYKIFGEVPGKKAYDRNINLTEDYPSHTNLSVMVNSTTVYVNFETLSIADPETATFTNIYPNPATEKIYIYTNGKNSLQKIMLYNTAGQLVQAQIYSAAQNAVLEVSQLPKGMYFLQLEYSNKTSERKKIIIAH